MSILNKFFFGGLITPRDSADPGAGAGDLFATEMGVLLTTIEREIRTEDSLRNYLDLRPSDSVAYQSLKKQPEKAAALARFIFQNRDVVIQPYGERKSPYLNHWRGFAVFTSLMRSSWPLEAEELVDWMAQIKQDCADKKGRDGEIRSYNILSSWPIGFMVQAVERKAKAKPLSDEVLDQLQAMLGWSEMNNETYYGTDFKKVKVRIEKLVIRGGGEDHKVIPYKKLSGDQFGGPLEAELKALPQDDADKWHRMFTLAASADGGKPSKAFLVEAKALKEELGKEWARTHFQNWIGRAKSASVIERTNRSEYNNYTWTERMVFTKSNATLLKGLVWMCHGFQDARTVNLIADLCEKSMQKVPGVGPSAQATANACLWWLEVTPGAEATARLARLGTAIKQKSVQKKVAAIVEKKAAAAGITTIQLEERVVPDYGLTEGAKSVAFDDFALRVVVEGPGKVSQTWVKPDGAVQKTKPKFIGEKAALKAKFDKVKAEIAALKKVLTAQRDRIDRLFAEGLEWPLDDIEQYYIGHGLVGVLAQRLIWALQKDGAVTAAIWRDGGWRDVKGAPVATSPATTVRLWHPIDWPVDEIMAWRTRLAGLGVMQPSKQAYREVYVLTDAEIATNTYSNRMAAHMLKQHQMATLMAARGWRYQLMGAYDDGLDDQWAHKSFVTSDLSAEFLLHTNWDGENWNDAGIYLYVGTDQLRFLDGATPVSLNSVPPRLLSEVMREADLFVGVASVGNDPAWADQGPTPEARNYWQSYSFGDLDGFAETRKQVLEALLPRLKIRDVAHIEGRYLIVDGKLNTYKIHLGSSNILMAPGDRYLCIVPGGVAKGASIALPFEGDNRLSVILSKALMLADDDKITASDIVSQLSRGR